MLLLSRAAEKRYCTKFLHRLLLQLVTASPVWLAAPVAAVAAAAPSPAGLLLLSSQAILLLLARSFLLSFAGRPCFLEAPVAAPPTNVAAPPTM
jgi:hypothetical protein